MPTSVNAGDRGRGALRGLHAVGEIKEQEGERLLLRRQLSRAAGEGLLPRVPAAGGQVHVGEDHSTTGLTTYGRGEAVVQRCTLWLIRRAAVVVIIVIIIIIIIIVVVVIAARVGRGGVDPRD